MAGRPFRPAGTPPAEVFRPEQGLNLYSIVSVRPDTSGRTRPAGQVLMKSLLFQVVI